MYMTMDISMGISMDINMDISMDTPMDIFIISVNISMGISISCDLGHFFGNRRLWRSLRNNDFSRVWQLPNCLPNCQAVISCRPALVTY